MNCGRMKWTEHAARVGRGRENSGHWWERLEEKGYMVDQRLSGRIAKGVLEERGRSVLD